MSIQGTGISLVRLDSEGKPITGERVHLTNAVDVGSVSEFSEPDGEVIIDGLKWMTLEVTFLEINWAGLHMIYGSRRVFGRPRKLAINGHEYNRRRRRR